MNNKIQAAVITPVLASGSTASPYYYLINLTPRLCYPTCVEETPVFAPQFSLVGLANIGTNQYVATIRVQGIISYVPCNGGCSCTKTQPISQEFSVPVQSATAPTSVTVTAGATINSIAANGCDKCSRTFVSETPISISVA